MIANEVRWFILKEREFKLLNRSPPDSCPILNFCLSKPVQEEMGFMNEFTSLWIIPELETSDNQPLQ